MWATEELLVELRDVSIERQAAGVKAAGCTAPESTIPNDHWATAWSEALREPGLGWPVEGFP
jgi:hypothetical protein